MKEEYIGAIVISVFFYLNAIGIGIQSISEVVHKKQKIDWFEVGEVVFNYIVGALIIMGVSGFISSILRVPSIAWEEGKAKDIILSFFLCCSIFGYIKFLIKEGYLRYHKEYLPGLPLKKGDRIIYECSVKNNPIALYDYNVYEVEGIVEGWQEIMIDHKITRMYLLKSGEGSIMIRGDILYHAFIKLYREGVLVMEQVVHIGGECEIRNHWEDYNKFKGWK